jgi:hypothetical protein
VGFLNRITQNFFGAAPLYINPEPARRYFKEREEREKANEETSEESIFKSSHMHLFSRPFRRSLT